MYPAILNTKVHTLPLIKVKQELDNLVKRVYKGRSIRIDGENKMKAYLVGEPYIDAVNQVIEYILHNEPEMADTIAISLNDEVKQILQDGHKDVENGNVLPIESILLDN